VNTDTAAAAGINQRRHLTIFFSDLSDSTRIAASMEPEDYAELLQQIRNLCEQIIPRHGGEIVRIDGDGVLCIFGYPEDYEDAGRRATEAAIDLHAAIAKLDAASASSGHRLRLHTGIHAGLVLLRSGDLVRGKYEILGDATNTAARLCDAAGPGEILVSTDTLGSDRHFFHTGPRRSVGLSGHEIGLPVWPITGRAAVTNRYDARIVDGLTPFQGRAAQRAAFFAGLEGGNGTPPIMLAHGPAGIGKSRFAQQMSDAARATGWSVARGYCESYLSARPLQPFLQIAEMLDIEFGSALIMTLNERASTTPLLLIIDDWQWADDASRDMLAALLEGEGDIRLKVLLTSREDGANIPTETAVTLLTLPPLDHEETLRTIDTLLKFPDPFAVDRIEQASGGSPLLIEELCLAFSDGGVAPGHAPRGAWFDQAVQARFARLAKADKRALKLAATIGHVVPAWLIQSLSTDLLDADMLARLQTADFLFPGETPDALRFKHGLTRDAIYAAIGLSDRKALHASILAAVEDAAERTGAASLLDALAYHSNAAGDHKALDYSIRAGDAALAVGALDRAQGHYQISFDAIEKNRSVKKRGTLLSRVINKFGLASVVDPSTEQLPFLRRAAAVARVDENAEALALSCYWEGSILYGVGDVRPSIQQLEAAMNLARPLNNSKLSEQIRLSLGQAELAAGNYVKAQELLVPTINTIERRSNGQTTGLAYALGCLAQFHYEQGRFDDADDCFRRAYQVLGGTEPAMLGSLLTKQTCALVDRGRYAEALSMAERSYEFNRRIRARFNLTISKAYMEFAQWQLDRDEGRVDALVRTLNQLEQSGSQHRASRGYALAAIALSECGQNEEARRFAAIVFLRGKRGDILGRGAAARALALLASQGYRRRRASHYLAMAYRDAEAKQSKAELAKTQLCDAEVAAASCVFDKASELALAARAAFDEMGMDTFAGHAQNLIRRAAICLS
jgi:class 3 adenylate cyclase